MDLVLYDTFTNSKKKFEPIDPNNVRMYVCGPTVYDYAHVGNARPVIVFDILFRLLQKIYGSENVTYVRNITDVDDKIIHAANDQNEDIGMLTEKTINYFHDDAKYIGALKPTFEPRATEHIPEMIELIEKLISKDFAYIADGNVLFSSNKFTENSALLISSSFALFFSLSNKFILENISISNISSTTCRLCLALSLINGTKLELPKITTCVNDLKFNLSILSSKCF